MQQVAARPGDWKCRGRLCQAHNFASKTRCFKCGNPKPGLGDWKCPDCNANNFPDKTACFKCGKPKPAAAEKPKRDRRKKKRSTFQNTGVYFENLPQGKLLFEVESIMRDLCMPFGTMRKVTAYKSKHDANVSQGDGLVVFTTAENADMACAQLQSHPTIRVTRATFQPKAKKMPTDGQSASSGTSGAAASAPISTGGAHSSVVHQSTASAQAATPAAETTVASNVPTLALQGSSVSDTVFMTSVFDIFAETSKDEMALKKKCAAFGAISKWYIDDDGNVLVRFVKRDDAFRCADKLHATPFTGKPLICDFVKSIEDPIPTAGRKVVITNSFSADQAKASAQFVPQLEVDFKAACSQYGPVTNCSVDPSSCEVTVSFSSSLCAADCQRGMHGRGFDGRVLHASVVDSVKASGPSTSSNEE